MPAGEAEEKTEVKMKPDPLVEDFLEFMAVEKNASHRTLANYEFALGEFKTRYAAFGSWEGCHSDDFRLYLFEQMKRELSRSTIRLHFAALRSFYKFLTRRRGLKANPLLDVQLPKAEKREQPWRKDARRRPF